MVTFWIREDLLIQSKQIPNRNGAKTQMLEFGFHPLIAFPGRSKYMIQSEVTQKMCPVFLYSIMPQGTSFRRNIKPNKPKIVRMFVANMRGASYTIMSIKKKKEAPRFTKPSLVFAYSIFLFFTYSESKIDRITIAAVSLYEMAEAKPDKAMMPLVTRNTANATKIS